MEPQLKLDRFLVAQDGKRGDVTLYELALKEIQEGSPLLNVGSDMCILS